MTGYDPGIFEMAGALNPVTLVSKRELRRGAELVLGGIGIANPVIGDATVKIETSGSASSLVKENRRWCRNPVSPIGRIHPGIRQSGTARPISLRQIWKETAW